MTEETREKLRESCKGMEKGKKLSEETKKKISETRKKRKLGCKKGRIVSQETRDKIRKKITGRLASYETRLKLRESHLGKKHSDEHRKKMSISMKKRFLDNEFLERKKKAEDRKPNKSELLLLNILKDDFNYVGDFSFWIEGKNPDYIHRLEKKVVEFFGDYYHGQEYRKTHYKDYKTDEEHEKDRIKHFNKNGYGCLVIWEKDLKNITDLLNKIKLFIGGENE